MKNVYIDHKYFLKDDHKYSVCKFDNDNDINMFMKCFSFFFFLGAFLPFSKIGWALLKNGAGAENCSSSNLNKTQSFSLMQGFLSVITETFIYMYKPRNVKP